MFRLKLNLKVALFNNTWIPDYLTGYWKSFKSVWRCLKICMKILVQIFEDHYWKSSEILARSLKMLKVFWQDSQRSWSDPHWSLHQTHGSLPYPQYTNLCKILTDLCHILTNLCKILADLCMILTNSPQLTIYRLWNFNWVLKRI